MINLDDSFLDELGIVDWGVTSDLRPTSFEQYESWVKEGKQGELGYLADERKEKRQSLEEVFPGCKTALVFLFSYKDIYFHYKKRFQEHRMASYALAYGDRDYHYVVKEKLQEITTHLEKNYPSSSFKLGIDTWPILERDLAYRAGLGWFGRNSMLINRHEGSLFFIGAILTDQEITTSDTFETDHCGHCNDCIISCPTLAIDPKTRTIEADKCISTFTIEMFKEVPAPEGMDKGNGEIFGCDICQDVCPWNIKLEKNISSKEETPASRLFDFFLARPLREVYEELSSWSNKKYVKEFKGTVVERTGRVGMMKNLKFYLE